MTDISKSFSSPRLSSFNIKNAMQMPTIPAMPRMPTTEERHAFESAGELLRRLALRIKLWQRVMPKDSQPVILAIMANGTPIRVTKLIEEGHNGIIVEGKIDNSPCMMLAHQNTLQLLCYVEQMSEPEKEKAPIGFQYQGQQEGEES